MEPNPNAKRVWQPTNINVKRRRCHHREGTATLLWWRRSSTWMILGARFSGSEAPLRLPRQTGPRWWFQFPRMMSGVTGPTKNLVGAQWAPIYTVTSSAQAPPSLWRWEDVSTMHQNVSLRIPVFYVVVWSDCVNPHTDRLVLKSYRIHVDLERWCIMCSITRPRANVIKNMATSCDEHFEDPAPTFRSTEPRPPFDGRHGYTWWLWWCSGGVVACPTFSSRPLLCVSSHHLPLTWVTSPWGERGWTPASDSKVIISIFSIFSGARSFSCSYLTNMRSTFFKKEGENSIFSSSWWTDLTSY